MKIYIGIYEILRMIHYSLLMDYICSYNYIFGEIIIKVFVMGMEWL